MKLFIRAQVIGFSVVGFTIAVALLIFNNQFFDFLGITVSENYALNQIKADLGGLWILIGVAPLLWLRTQDNFWIRILFVILGFVIIARVISFVQEGFHPISIFLLISEIWLFLFTRYILKNYPEESFFK
ncbi:MAG: hypothetical protein ISQ16_04415 [Candidatus Actinomarina sp.]|nr:hypothetical protein [Candidatus Actinomarina sp.]MDA3009073.1 hypothetical protein [Actinomycetota bacterium]